MEVEVPSAQKERIENLLGCLRQGDDSVRKEAVHELIQNAVEFWRDRTHQKLVRRRDIRRWEDTDDLMYNAMARLARALTDVKLESAEHFLHLAGREINRELTDMARKIYGPEGIGRNHHTDAPSLDSDAVPLYEAAQDTTNDPVKLAEWTEFQKQIEDLPEKERAVFKLWFRKKMSLVAIGKSLGVCTETAERRWRSACKLLRKAREDQAPGS